MNAFNQKSLLLPVVVAAAAIAALVWRNQGEPTVTGEPIPPSSQAANPAASPPAGGPEARGSIQGKVAEKLDVSQYTYLRVSQPGGADVWTAVPRAEVAVGDTVTVHNPERMEGFKSSTLNRTFDVIFFGTLAGDAEGPSGPNPHGAAALGSAAPVGSDGTNPHLQPGAEADAVVVGKVERAPGPNGKTVAEVHAGKGELGGKALRVRGVVVKVVPGVLGRTFVHVRDGSGDATAGTHDLTVTTTEQPEVGQTVLYEGNLAVDKDFGSGYRYPVLLEEARTVTE